MLDEKKKEVRDSKFEEKEYKNWYVGLALVRDQTRNFLALDVLNEFLF